MKAFLIGTAVVLVAVSTLLFGVVGFIVSACVGALLVAVPGLGATVLVVLAGVVAGRYLGYAWAGLLLISPVVFFVGCLIWRIWYNVRHGMKWDDFSLDMLSS